MPLKSREFKQDSNTQVSFSNPNTVVIQGNAGGLTLRGGTATSDVLTLENNSTTWPRTARTQTDFLTIGQSFAYPTGSAAAFNSIICSPSITGIDVSNPNITTFNVNPAWTNTVAQSWGLVVKAGLNFQPTLTNNVAGGLVTDNVIFAGANFQPQVNGTNGPTTYTNVWGIAVDPRQIGTAGTVTAMIGVRNRGNTVAGATVTTFTAYISEYSSPAGSTTTTYRGLNIAPSLLGTISTFEGVRIAAQTGPSVSNIGFYQLGTAMHNRFQGRVRIGTDAAPAFMLQVSETSTATSGTVTLQNNSLVLNPASNSTSTVYGLDLGLNTSAGASNPSALINGQRLIVQRSATDTGSVATMRGLTLFTFNNAVLSTGQGAVPTLLEGAEIFANDNSNTTTTTTTIRGLNTGVSIGSNTVSSRVFTNAIGLHTTIGLSAGSTLTTITNASVLLVDAGTTGSLNRTGTYTNAVGINVTGWTTAGVFGSGLTFTNAPEQIRLQSMSITGSIGIRQQGATPHNRFEGQVMIGSDAAPDAYLEIMPAPSSGTVKPDFIITGGANTALTATVERSTFKVTPGSQQWATGALGSQRFNFFDQPTVAFVGSSTLSTAYNIFAFVPTGGTNATITNSIAVGIGGTTVSNVTNSYALSASATTGATNNYAATFNGGNVGIRTLAPTAYLHIAAGTATANTAPLKFTTGVNTTVVEPGAHEWDGSRLYITSDWATDTRQELVTSMLKDVTVITTNNTNVETTHFTTTLPGGALGASRGIRCIVMGHIKNNKGSAGTVTYRFKYGGTTVYSGVHTVANDGTASNERPTQINFWMTARNSASVQEVDVTSKVYASGTMTGTGLAIDSELMGHYHGLTITSSNDQTFEFTIQMNATSSAFQVITDTVFLELV